MERLTIVKIGGSVITYKESRKPRIRRIELLRVAKEIRRAYLRFDSNLLLIHGAGSYGHEHVKKSGINEGIKTKEQLMDFAEVQRLQIKLNCIVTQSLLENRLPAFPCQPSSCTVMKSKKIAEMGTRAIKGLLDAGLIPILYGVPAYDEDRGCSILSGDDIASHLAVALRAERVIFGTNVDGVFTDKPNRPNAKLIDLVNSKNFDNVTKILLKSSTNSDATGGMLRKVLRAAEASVHGIESVIVNASSPSALRRAIEGEKLGTLIEDISGDSLKKVNKILECAGMDF